MLNMQDSIYNIENMVGFSVKRKNNSVCNESL